jgi:DNA-binding XRE family transcriptional regulator
MRGVCDKVDSCAAELVFSFTEVQRFLGNSVTRSKSVQVFERSLLMNLDAFLKQVGKNIANFRKSHALTQRDVANKVGITYRYFQSIESGNANMTLSTLFRISQFFGVQIYELVPSQKT